MGRPRFLGFGLALALAAPLQAQQVYPPSPDWVSADTQVSTGGALADLDRDGWLDFIVSNGNDMAQQHVVVYYNQGDGTFPSLPDWQSADIAYNGHLDVADVNGDGWLDVAVAYLGEFSTTGPIARVYLNNGGVLSPTPSWSANATGNAFGVAFGDLNADGRPDLAVATGWPYSNPSAYYNYVYLNVGGQLGTTWGWRSADRNDYMSMLWLDGDGDGWMDLVGVGAHTYTWLYRNTNGTLATSASWHTTDNVNQYSIMAVVGDVTGDGRRDLIVTDNTQLTGGSGYFRQYTGQATGDFSPSWSWQYYDGYGSAVALADVDADGDLDLATGAWWDKTRIFFNTGTGLPTSPGWNSAPSTVIEKIVFGDVNKDGLRPIADSFSAAGSRRLFYLGHQPIQEITAVRVDGTALLPSQFTYNRENGWVSVGVTPTTELRVEYTYSSKLDMAITNWDDTIGNYLYYNQLVVPGDADCSGRLDLQDILSFVILLADRAVYDAQLPDCDVSAACDLNHDGAIDGLDIQPFVNALLAP
jgi:hypothetical protein